MTIEVTCTDAHHRPLDRLWRLLFQIGSLAAQPGQPTIRLDLTATAPPASLFDQAVGLFRAESIQVWQLGEDFGLSCGESVLLIDCAQQYATGFLAPNFWQTNLAAQREFFQLLFFLLLRRQARYLLHANAIIPPTQPPDRALLLIGDCGTGKTTLTLSLLQRGWHCVGDDLLLLEQRDTQIVAYGVRRGLSCTAQTAAAFPELQAQLQEGPPLTRHKKFVQWETLFPRAHVPMCQPDCLLFPQIVAAETSWLTPLTPTQSMVALLQQPRAGILVDPPTVAGQLALFAELVQQVAGYQLYLGRDVLEQPAQLSHLLATTCRSTRSRARKIEEVQP